MPEKVYYNNNGYSVTSSRFTTPEKTYFMHDVTSVSYQYSNPSYATPIGFIFIGILSIITGSITHFNLIIIIGAILSATGILLTIFRKKTYYIIFVSASGELEVMRTKDLALINKIHSALKKAIIDRK
jgi:hypothetical protein